MATKTAVSDNQELPYTIESVDDANVLTPTGKIQRSKSIRYRTMWGDTGTVTLPATDFKAEKVAALIMAEVETIIELRGMGG